MQVNKLQDNPSYKPNFNAKFQVKGYTDSIYKGFTKDFRKAAKSIGTDNDVISLYIGSITSPDGVSYHRCRNNIITTMIDGKLEQHKIITYHNYDDKGDYNNFKKAILEFITGLGK